MLNKFHKGYRIEIITKNNKKRNKLNCSGGNVHSPAACGVAFGLADPWDP